MPQTHEGEWSYLHAFLTLSLHGGEWSASHHREKSVVPIRQEARRAQNQSGCGDEEKMSLPLLRTESRSLIP